MNQNRKKYHDKFSRFENFKNTIKAIFNQDRKTAFFIYEKVVYML